MDVNPLIVIAFFLLLFILLCRLLHERYTLLKRIHIPGPAPTWVFGNVKEFRDKHPLDVFKNWYKIYGKVYGFYEGFRTGIVVNDPEMAKHILLKQFDKFHIRTPYRPFQYYPSNSNLVNLHGEHWKAHRHVLSKVLGLGDSMQTVVNKVLRRTEKLIDILEKERQKYPESLNIAECIQRYVTSASLSILTNLTENQLEADIDNIYRYQKASLWSASADNQACGLARLFPSLTSIMKLFDTDHKKKHKLALTAFRNYLQNCKNCENNNTNHGEECLLHQLATVQASTKDKDGNTTKRHLEDDEILAHVLAMLNETFETVSSAILFILYELALHSGVQDKLYEEITENINIEQGEIDYHQLQKLEYLDMVFYESTRLHPIAPGVKANLDIAFHKSVRFHPTIFWLARQCVTDCEINGVQFKKNMSVRYMLCTLYNDEKYFPEPEKFIPERFSPQAKQDRHPCVFLPFGIGQRKCPGFKIAKVKVKLAIVAILRKYTIHRSQHTEVPLKHALRPSLCPANGVNVMLKERSAPNSAFSDKQEIKPKCGVNETTGTSCDEHNLDIKHSASDSV